MSKGKSDMEGVSRSGDDSMRESYHFTDTLTAGDIGTGVSKLENMDEVMSEEKV